MWSALCDPPSQPAQVRTDHNNRVQCPGQATLLSTTHWRLETQYHSIHNLGWSLLVKPQWEMICWILSLNHGMTSQSIRIRSRRLYIIICTNISYTELQHKLSGAIDFTKLLFFYLFWRINHWRSEKQSRLGSQMEYKGMDIESLWFIIVPHLSLQSNRS